MKILLVGSGAREHAIARALVRSSNRPQIFCVASSHHPGLMELATGFLVGNICDTAAVVQFARAANCTLAIIGPEAPLAVGLADALWAAGIATVGPRRRLAQIETSKVFARDLMREFGIPGLPRYQCFHDIAGVEEWLTTFDAQGYVIKADGLAGGKGVRVAGEHLHSLLEALAFCESLIAENRSFVIEEKFIGQEFSLMAFCDGVDVFFMPIVQDHKRAFVGDVGPNTGGMGSFSCADHTLPFLTKADITTASEITRAVFHALQTKCQENYHGILYGSFIATADGIGVIEFNARFGDPEAMNVLAILTSDFVDLCVAMTSGQLANYPIHFAPQATVCKYAVPNGYPDRPEKNVEIRIDQEAIAKQIYLAAVDTCAGKLIALGSRAVAAVGVADTLTEAEQAAEKAICLVQGPLFHRQDIGTADLISQRVAIMQRLRGS